MDFTSACALMMPLGKYKGKTIARVGANKEGLLYLDWLIGQDWVDGRLRMAIEAFLHHPSIAMQLDSAIEEGE